MPSRWFPHLVSSVVVAVALGVCLSGCSGQQGRSPTPDDNEQGDTETPPGPFFDGGDEQPDGFTGSDGSDGDSESVGSACNGSDECDGNHCLSNDVFEGGYCTSRGCTSVGTSTDCPGQESICMSNARGPNFCVSPCQKGSDCRNGYACKSTSAANGNRVCVPEGTNPNDGYDTGGVQEGHTGASCESDLDCEPGISCVSTPQFPGGYCSKLHCRSDDDCTGGDAECREPLQGTSMCVRDCGGGCRKGYACEDSVCVPDGSTLTAGFPKTRYDLGFLCQPKKKGVGSLSTRWEFTFEIAESTESYMFVPLTLQGRVRASELDTPSRQIDLIDDYHHQKSWRTGSSFEDPLIQGGRYGDVMFSDPTQVPYAPQYDNYVTPGIHRLTVQAPSKPCLYVLQRSGDGSTLNLDIYPVASGLDEVSARTDADWDQAMSEAEDFFQTADIRFGDVSYHSIPGRPEDFQIVRSKEQLYRLMGQGKRTGQSLDDRMSVDIFLVDEIRVREDTTSMALGVAGKLPGPPGLHGNPREGVVVSVSNLGSDNTLVGEIVAHEVSHYLGLRHTTEVVHKSNQGQEMQRAVGTTDPIRDTPVCSDISDRRLPEVPDCPDFNNLMFPIAGGENASLTSGQEAVLQSNPLIR